MQIGEYVHQRILPEAVRAACRRQGLHCQSFSGDWVHRISSETNTAWICGYKTTLNSSAASQIAQDKVATYIILSENGIPAVRHALVRAVQTQPIDYSQLEAQFSEEVVVKPLDGTSGRGVRRYGSLGVALDEIRGSSEPAWAVSPYLDIAAEKRFILLDGELLLAYDKQNPITQHGLKFFNLGHGAVAVDLASTDVPAGTLRLAIESSASLGLRLAAVDVVTLQDGTEHVLEINDGFSMEHYALQSPQNKNRAIQLYDAVVAKMLAA